MRPVGAITRGTTNPNRLRRCDRRLAGPQAFNVLRQYAETDVTPSWELVCGRLAPGGLLVDGTCDEIGRRATWVALDADGPISLTLSWRLAGLRWPSEIAERLPKALINRNVPGEPVHTFLAALDGARARQAGYAAYGVRQWFVATARALAAAGWQQPARWRLGELTIGWAAVVPRGRPWPDRHRGSAPPGSRVGTGEPALAAEPGPATAQEPPPVTGTATLVDPAPLTPGRTPAPEDRGWAAIVLAGGRSRRMGGIDKILADVGGRTVLDRVLAACVGHRIVVVGPAELAGRIDAGARLVREEPPFGGPVAGVRAGLGALVSGSGVPDDGSLPARPARIALIAGDQPRLAPAVLDALVARLAATGADVAALTDDTGHRQYLCAMWDTTALIRAVATAGESMRSVYAAARIVDLADRWGASIDVDTADDLTAARVWSGPSPIDSGRSCRATDHVR